MIRYLLSSHPKSTINFDIHTDVNQSQIGVVIIKDRKYTAIYYIK